METRLTVMHAYVDTESLKPSAQRAAVYPGQAREVSRSNAQQGRLYHAITSDQSNSFTPTDVYAFRAFLRPLIRYTEQ